MNRSGRLLYAILPKMRMRQAARCLINELVMLWWSCCRLLRASSIRSVVLLVRGRMWIVGTHKVLGLPYLDDGWYSYFTLRLGFLLALAVT